MPRYLSMRFHLRRLLVSKQENKLDSGVTSRKARQAMVTGISVVIWEIYSIMARKANPDSIIGPRRLMNGGMLRSPIYQLPNWT